MQTQVYKLECIKQSCKRVMIVPYPAYSYDLTSHCMVISAGMFPLRPPLQRSLMTSVKPTNVSRLPGVLSRCRVTLQFDSLSLHISFPLLLSQ
ncbi:hypothetical protein FKM82_030154 [Ascaphus truei]